MLRKIILALMIITLFQPLALACDICGCGVGSYYIGILPEFRKRFMGLRYQFKALQSHISPDGSISYLTSDESYQTLELWGAVNIGKRFRVLAFIPVNINERTNQGITSRKSGLGDIAMVGYYNLLNSRKTVGNKLLVQTLWMGGGAKLPTGEYNPEEKNISQGLQNTFQLGTASVDFTLNGMYDIRLQDAGINTNISYKLNTRNRYGYQYGNKFTTNVLFYYKIRIAKDITIAPNTGILYEKADRDLKNKMTYVDDSGGNSVTGTIGTELSINRIGMGVNFQTPLSQHLGGGTIKAGNRVMAHISMAF